MSFSRCAPCFSHPLFLGTYLEDIVHSLYDKEATRNKFKFTSPQIDFRCLLIDFMKNFAEHRKFQRTTMHLGAYLLDYFMDNHEIALERLNIVSLVCLILAAKIEEVESMIPNLTEIKKLTNVECSLADYISLEEMILTFFDWNVMQPTAVTFIELYLDAIISQEDFDLYNTHVTSHGTSFKDLKSMKMAASNMIFEYLDLALSHLQFCEETPSKLAAAIIAVTRCTFGLDPVWTDKIARVTGYQLAYLEKLMTVLFQAKNASDSENELQDKRKNTPDSGYISSKETDTDEEDEDDDVNDQTKRLKV